MEIGTNREKDGERATKMARRETEWGDCCNLRMLQSSILDSDGELRRPHTDFNWKNKIMSRIDYYRGWEDLPEELLEIISNFLEIIDIPKLGRVCKNWRSTFLASKDRFWASQPPLLGYIYLVSTSPCYFYEINNRINYKNNLPDHFQRKNFIGLSYGYLIMEDFCSNISMIHLLTSEQHQFPKLPCLPRHNEKKRSIVARSRQNHDFLLIVLIQKMGKIFRFRQSSDEGWIVYKFLEEPSKILDITIFEERVYALASNAHVYILSLKSPSNMIRLDLKHNPPLTRHARFVASRSELLIIDYFRGSFKVYKIDFERREWIKLKGLGGRTLFVSDMTCLSLSDSARWGGRRNCLFFLPFRSNFVLCYSLEDGCLGRSNLRLRIEIRNHQRRFWFFPNRSCDVDYVIDD